jgi:hypothetical protein
LERNLLLGVIAMVVIVVAVVVVAISWDSLTGDDGGGEEEVPDGIHLKLTRPEKLKEYNDHFPVKGVATSSEGFVENTTVQWKLRDDPVYGEWRNDTGWDRDGTNRIDIYFELDMSQGRIGIVVLMVRAFDGKGYSNVVEVPIKLK